MSAFLSLFHSFLTFPETGLYGQRSVTSYGADDETGFFPEVLHHLKQRTPHTLVLKQLKHV